MKKMKVRATFTEEMLGTASNKKDIHERFIASKAPDAEKREEEVAAIGVEEATEMDMTVFPRTPDGKPALFDYQIKGFLKNAAKAHWQMGGDDKLSGYKGKIDNLVFVFPRMIPLQMPEGRGLGSCQRPLRAQTAQGERIALANSEAAPEGTVIDFEMQILDDTLVKRVKDWLDYGKLNGIGQWHNSGKGRFEYEIISED